MKFFRLKGFFNISATLFGNIRKYLYLCQMKSDSLKIIAIWKSSN